jgi:hypothetical protein
VGGRRRLGGWSATWAGRQLDRFALVIFILRANHALLPLNIDRFALIVSICATG